MTEKSKSTESGMRDQLISNVRHALTLPWPQLNEAKPAQENQDVVIVDNGVSVAGCVSELQWQKKHGRAIWALGPAYQWLVEKGIEPDRHILLDPRANHRDFVPRTKNVSLLYASQCHPDVFVKAAEMGAEVLVWHAKTEGIAEILEGRPTALIGFGSTLALKAIGLAYILGFRNIYLFGYDSSFQDDKRQAFGISDDNQEKMVTVTVDHQRFSTSPFWAAQAKEFSEIMPVLMEKGCRFIVRGSGLLPTIAQKITQITEPGGEPPLDIVQIQGMWWPRHDKMCRPFMEHTFGDIHEIVKLCRGRSTIVQAGGNVGVWPIEFSKYFSHVITFEPDALNYACLVRNIKNHPNIDALNLGVGDKSEKVGLAREEENCGAHFVEGDGDITIIKIDDMNLQDCDLIQLDVEGYEYKALAGASETIKRFKPVIVTEEKRHGERYGIKDEEIEKLLAPFGYKKAHNIHRDVVYIADKAPQSSTLNVCCLKWGNKYSADYVNRLAAMVRRNLSLPHRFVCFTDDPSGIHPSVECLPLLDNELEGWWHKISFFRSDLHDLKGTLLFLDLDIVIVGSLNPFFEYPGKFCIIEDWLSAGKPLYNSSIFRLEIGSMTHVYNQFKKQDRASIQQKYPGDQEWISQHVSGVTLWPAAWCVSFKWQCALPHPEHPAIPDGSRIIVFHGKPDPHEAMGRGYKIYGPSLGSQMDGQPAPWIASFWNVKGLIE